MGIMDALKTAGKIFRSIMDGSSSERKMEEPEPIAQMPEVKFDTEKVMETTEELMKAAERVNKGFRELGVQAQEAAKAITIGVQRAIGQIDEWQYKKMQMSNNERRRRGIPMVRRRAGLRAARSGRRTRMK